MKRSHSLVSSLEKENSAEGFSGYCEVETTKKAKPEPLQKFINALFGLVRQKSNDFKSVKQKPMAIRDTNYLNLKTTIYFSIQFCDTKAELFDWITQIFVPVWEVTVLNNAPEKMFTRRLQTAVREKIINECKKVYLFDPQEVEQITEALTVQLERTDTVPLELSNSGSGTGTLPIPSLTPPLLE